MTFNEELTILLVGAGIALVSSLLTTVVTSLLSERSARRAKHAAKLERLYYLTGKMAALKHDTPESISDDLAEELDALKKGLPALNKVNGLVDGAIGSLETWLEKSEGKQE
ncbi:MAG: hypothetical protein WCE68_13790 [Anaerolineales bacterium]